MSYLPPQKIPLSERTEDWKILNIDHFIDSRNISTIDRDESALFRAANGELDAADYKYVLNPYDSTDKSLSDHPAMMRNIDIISPIINSFMGEMAEKTMSCEVIVTNSDVINNFKADLNKQMYALAAQEFVNMLNANGENTGVPTEEIPEFKEFVENYKENWNDQRAIFGQEALDYIRYNCDLKDKYQDAFYDWLVTGRCYSYKEPRDNDVHIEIVPVDEISHGSTPTNFIEDAPWVVRAFERTPSAIVDMFRHELKDEDITFLESISNSSFPINDTFSNIGNVGNSRRLSFYNRESNLITVFHCTWKTFKEVAILTYEDPETGKIEQMEVDPDYKLDESSGDISLEKEWINEGMEGYRVDRSIYLKIQPLLAQRNELNNSSKCKLPYNGRVGYSKYNKYGSVVRTLLNYQALYNIYHFRAELTLAKNKDKIMLMPLGLMPKGWSVEKSLWYAENTGVMFFDETKENAQAVLNAIKGIDLSLGSYVQEIRNLLREIKDEAWDSVGMNRQRYGDVKASDGKANTEQAISRSSTITREMFRKFEKFVETDKQGLLDISKIAWIDGKKTMYVRSDGAKKFFEVNGYDHLEADYGVFAKDSMEEQAKLNSAKELTRMMAQKGGVGASLMFETLDANNFAQLKSFARKFEEIQQQIQQQSQQSQQENEQMLQDKIDKNDALNRENKIQIAEIQTRGAIQSAQIKSDTDLAKASMQNDSTNEEEPADTTGLIMKELLKSKNERDKLGLAASKNNQDSVYKERELELKNKKIEIDEKIARTNKNKYD